jgi:hypothetical protein
MWELARGDDPGRRVRSLTIIDKRNRDALEIATDMSLPSRVVRVLNDLINAFSTDRCLVWTNVNRAESHQQVGRLEFGV